MKSVDMKSVYIKDIEAEEVGLDRLNIIVPTDCVFKIDKLKEAAGFASRGRTIQEAIDTIWELREDFYNIDHIFPKIFESSNEKSLIIIMPILFSITKRIGRFGHENENEKVKLKSEQEELEKVKQR